MTDLIALVTQLPTKAKLVHEAWGTHPTHDTTTLHRPHTAGAAPTNLDQVHAFWGGLATLQQIYDMLCEETVTTTNTPEAWALYDNPPITPNLLTDRITALTAWQQAADWLTHHHTLWTNDTGTIDLLHAINRNLNHAAGTPKPIRLICPKTGCGWPLHPQDEATWYKCEAGHTIDAGPHIARYLIDLADQQPATIPEAAHLLNIPERTLRRRVRNAGLTPTSGRGRRTRYPLAALRTLATTRNTA